MSGRIRRKAMPSICRTSRWSRRRRRRRPRVASQWQLMRWKFRKHKLAVISLWILGLPLLRRRSVAEFLAPADPETGGGAVQVPLAAGAQLHRSEWQLQPAPRRLRPRQHAQPGDAARLLYARTRRSGIRSTSSCRATNTRCGASITARPAPLRPRAGGGGRRKPRSTSSAPTASGAICSRGSSTARASRSLIGLISVVAEPGLRDRARRHLGLLRRRGR